MGYMSHSRYVFNCKFVTVATNYYPQSSATNADCPDYEIKPGSRQSSYIQSTHHLNISSVILSGAHFWFSVCYPYSPKCLPQHLPLNVLLIGP